jgi:copper transport protein
VKSRGRLAWLLLPLPLLAMAHAHLEQSEPADGAVIPVAPAQIVLHFSEAAQLTALSLQQQGQSTVRKLGPLSRDPATRISVPSPPLEPGGYELRYRVISADGHVMAGSVHFTIAAP